MKNGRRNFSFLRACFWIVACFYSLNAFAYFIENPSDKASKACTSRGAGYSLNNISSPVYGQWYTEVKNGNTYKTRLVDYTYQCNLTENGTTFQYGSGGVSVYDTQQICTSPAAWDDNSRQCAVPTPVPCPANQEKIDGVCVDKCEYPQVRDPVMKVCVDKCASTKGKRINIGGYRSAVPADGSYGPQNLFPCVGQCLYSIGSGSISGHVCTGKDSNGKPTGCHTYYTPSGYALGLGQSCQQRPFEITFIDSKSGQTVDTAPNSNPDGSTGGGGNDGGNGTGSDGSGNPDSGSTIDTKQCNNLDQCYYKDPASCVSKGMVPNSTSGGYVCTKPKDDGSVTTTDTKTDTKTNSDGTKTTTTKTTDTKTNGDGTVTTTTVINNNGEKSTEEKTQDKKGFCEENPNSTICKDSSVNGSCQAFTCTGDAVQCEIAKMAWKAHCDGEKETKFTQDGNDAASGKLGKDAISTMKDGLSKNIGSDKFNQTAFLGGGCLQDKQFSAGGRTFTIPFSEMCQYLEYMGFFVMGVAFLISIGIVFGNSSK